MKTKQKMIMATLMLSMLALLSTTAQADPLTLSLSNPNQSGSIGDTLTFIATVFNGAGVVTITNDSFGFPSPPGDLTLDDSPFLTNFLGQTVASAASRGPLSLFTVTIGPAAVPGTTYTGVFSIIYDGAMPDLETNLVEFSVTVLQAPGAIPEPTTMVLLGSGLFVLAGAVRRRRRAA